MGWIIGTDGTASLPVGFLTPRPRRFLRRARNSRTCQEHGSEPSSKGACVQDVRALKHPRPNLLEIVFVRAKPSNVRSVRPVRVPQPTNRDGSPCEGRRGYPDGTATRPRIWRYFFSSPTPSLNREGGIEMDRVADRGTAGTVPRTDRSGRERTGRGAELTRWGNSASSGGMPLSPKPAIPRNRATGPRCLQGRKRGPPRPT
jgi:hypothetical protein